VAGSLALALTVVIAPSPAHALIEALMPLEEVIQKQSTFIFTAKVDRLDPDKPAVVLTVDEALKGKVPFTRLPINLTGDSYAKRHEHTQQLLKRLTPKLGLVLFVSREGKQYIALGYTNGTWFQLTATDDGENPVWRFTHCEPYLRRTFKGTTAEMQKTVADSLAGKKAAPKPDAKEKPGLGPEVEEKPKDKPSASAGSDGPLFAVIPTVAIGGIVSLLAMLFPAVFGGLTGQLKRWAAVIAVASLNSTLLFLHDWLALPGSWGTQATLWLAMTLVTILGVLWAWRRQLRQSFSRDADGATALSAPSRYELMLLAILSGIGVVLLGICLLLGYPLLTLPWSFVVALWIGIWAGTVYVLLVWRRPPTQPSLSSEGVILWAMLPACLVLAPAPPALATAGVGGGAVQSADGTRSAEFVKATPLFAPQGIGGAMYARPLIDGDRIYAAVAYQPSAFGTPGNLYCIERSTGKVLWDFNSVNGQRMKEVFSSPCIADGRVFVGEGFHSDSDCKLYCIDAATGKKLWEHPTGSHTESSPCVAGVKVYTGAGADGLLCLNAATGDLVWQYKGGHIDCPPTVAGQRVYGGSAVDRDIDGPQETAVFCLDAETGHEVWRERTGWPAWGKPIVSGEQVFFPLGNGDVMKSVEPPEKPAGQILCMSTEGAHLWIRAVPDGVMGAPAVDQAQVYFGCRNGRCYCLSRSNGQPRWSYDLGSPVIAGPALAACACCAQSSSVYVVARDGKVCCLDPISGRLMWQYDRFSSAQLLSPPVVTVERTPQGDRRGIYFGAGLAGNSQVALYCLEDVWKD
jgi:outer membrane protein assembly factor BamB